MQNPPPKKPLPQKPLPQKPVPIKRALLSVSDKTGIVELARALVARDIEIISTGGTARCLTDAKLPVRTIAELTGFPEIMDGRVKTLHPKLHGGLLAKRDDPDHLQAMETHAIAPIDLLVVNLYPFESTPSIETIDIGGPAMIRAAAKNYAHITTLVDGADYPTLLAEMDAHNGGVSPATRAALAQKAFARVASYDAAISNWMAEQFDITTPSYRAFGGRLHQSLRYGENPHQQAGFYKDAGLPHFGVATATQIQGKPLSYNNINDTDAAYELVAAFDPSESACCAIIKHANPCGVALGATLCDAYESALHCDPVSAFGGIIASNRPLDAESAEKITEIFTEVIIAPDATDEARAIVARKKNVRLLVAGGLPDTRQSRLMVRGVGGGWLVQSADTAQVTRGDLRVVTKRAPTDAEYADLLMAFRVAKHVKSNAIVYAQDGATLGIGAGQMSRLDSARIAAHKMDALADKPQSGIVAASDAFFPFADGLESIAAAGATAVIQPGGSMRDDAVIDAADKAGLAMVFTGVRHFRH